MQFEEEEEDILEILLLEPRDNLPIASLILEEESVLLGWAPEAQLIATHPHRHKECAPEPESVARLGEALTELQGMWRCPPPPGFKSQLPGQDIPLIGVSDLDKAQSLLTPVGAMSLVI